MSSGANNSSGKVTKPRNKPSYMVFVPFENGDCPVNKDGHVRYGPKSHPFMGTKKEAQEVAKLSTERVGYVNVYIAKVTEV